MQLSDIRKHYPQYDDLTDRELADALYNRYYTDMDRIEFDAGVGLVQPAAEVSRETVKTDWRSMFDSEDPVDGDYENLNFVQRYLEPSKYPTLDTTQPPWAPGSSMSTHRMAANGVILPGDTEPTEIVYPTIIQLTDGKLQELNDEDALQYAVQTGEYIPFEDPVAARAFAENGYKVRWGEKDLDTVFEASTTMLKNLPERAQLMMGGWIRDLGETTIGADV